MDLKKCKEFYSKLGDDTSKELYELRIMYSLTNDNKYMKKMVNTMPPIQKLLQIVSNSDKPIFLYGAGIRAKRLVHLFPNIWNGIIDKNEQKWGTYIENVKIISIDKVLKQNPIIVISNKNYSDEITQMLYEKGINKNSIIQFGSDLNTYLEKQYFDLPVIPHHQNEVFVDCGAYDGQSSYSFMKWCNNQFKNIYMFEPDISNIEKLYQKMKELYTDKKIKIINKATWNSTGKLSFCQSGTEASKISVEDGTALIQTTTLDEELHNEIVTFVKMDIEGAELETLEGSHSIIVNQTPTLAISIYHKMDDIFSIPELLLEYNDNYTFYLRHYSLERWDTVLYALFK